MHEPRLDALSVEHLLGVGRLGPVWQVRHRERGSRHALRWVTDPALRATARADARVARALDHRGIARVNDLFDVPEGTGVLLEWVGGPTLARLVAARPLQVPEALAIFHVLLDAVEHAHAHGAVHGDLRPARVRLSVDGDAIVPKLTGFRRPPRDRAYAPPERSDASLATPADDFYGLGRLLGDLVGQRIAPGGVEEAKAALLARHRERLTDFARIRALLGPADPDVLGGPLLGLARRLAGEPDTAGTEVRSLPGLSGPTRPAAGTDPDIAARFDLLALGGEGAMGQVWRAFDRVRGIQVACKLLSAGDFRRFEREAVVLAQLEHPSIVRYRDSGVTAGGVGFLTMDWLEGQDLARRLARGPLPVPDALQVLGGLAQALAAAHRAGIVHRDVKPANVFLVGDRPDAACLVDFGLARPDSDGTLTASGVIVGTPAFMAPEQISGARVGPTADVYAAGAVLFACLCGRPPFEAPNAVAILARAILESPPRISELRPDVPPGLDALVARLLDKEPANRPADGAALLEALRGLDLTPSRLPPAPTRERRVESLVLCRAAGEDARLRDAVAPLGGTLEPLAEGIWLLSVSEAGSAAPTDTAARAARCALALVHEVSGAHAVLATGRTVVGGARRVGEVIDRALGALLAEGYGARVDASTADLLGDGFVVRGEGAWRDLVAVRSPTEIAQTLLGRPVPCVGRTQELASLAAALASTEDGARAVLITGAPGLGKSRLLHEFLHAQVLGRPHVRALFSRGDPAHAGASHATTRQLVLGAAEAEDAPPDVARERLRAALARDGVAHLAPVLAEVAGVPVPQAEASPALRAARVDATTLGDLVREAWVAWLRAITDRDTLVLVLEDLHWSDLPSVRLAEAALDLADRPILLVATGRPEVHKAFPTLFRRHARVELELGPLPARAVERLARDALGAEHADAIRVVVDRAGGHPFHLEELIRAVKAGRGTDALPDSILGMLQARFDRLAPETRRLVRAASVFGQGFDAAGVAAVLGEAPARIEPLLGRVAEDEWLDRRRTPDGIVWSFRHALVRDAAYAMLTDDDRARFHRGAAEWLSGIDAADPAVLADHWERGGAPERAAADFERAARRALAGNDYERADALATRGLACGPEAELAASLTAVTAEVAFWRGEHAAAEARAAAAAAGSAPGSSPWFHAVSVAIRAAGQLGRNDAVASWLARAAAAEGPGVVAICQGVTQLVWAHHPADLRALVARAEEDLPRLDPYEAAWVYRALGECAFILDWNPDRCLADLDASAAGFRAAGARRAGCLARINRASLTGWSGDAATGLAGLDEAEAEVRALGGGFLLTYGETVRALLRAYAGDPGAEDAMSALCPSLGPSPRLQFIALLVAGELALRRGAIDLAGERADAASRLPVVAAIAPAAPALASRVALARGDRASAVALARRAVAASSPARDLDLLEGGAHLALALAGEPEEAAAARAEGLRRIAVAAVAIADPVQRAAFLARPLYNDLLTGSS